jgi:dihydroxyacetone kinase-like predicted kinase
MLRLAPEGDFDEVVKDMKDALDDIVTGEITTATRSAEIDGVSCQIGQFIGLHNGRLVLATTDLEAACLGLLEKAGAEKYELITLFSGADVPKHEVNRIVDVIRCISKSGG